MADPPAVLAKGSSSGKGGAGAARVGPLADDEPPRELARCLGGAGRGGGCLPFFGGNAGVGLSARAACCTGANGSVPKGSAAAATWNIVLLSGHFFLEATFAILNLLP